MNASDYGGGTPIVDVWRRDVGLAVGHIEPGPRLISLPVSMPDAVHARVAVRSTREQTLEPGESFHTLRTFVSVHQGDYFRTLTEYRRLMMRQGFQMASAPDSAFGPIWCAWGYGRSVQLKQVYDTLPTAKKLGFSWVTLDDGWQNNYGDWELDPKKFPHGDADMKALVDRIHEEGFRRAAVVVAAERRAGFATAQRTSRYCVAQSRRIAAENFLVELGLSLPSRSRGCGVSQSAGSEDPGRVGIRWPQTGRPAHERGSPPATTPRTITRVRKTQWKRCPISSASFTKPPAA